MIIKNFPGRTLGRQTVYTRGSIRRALASEANNLTDKERAALTIALARSNQARRPAKPYSLAWKWYLEEIVRIAKG